MPFLAGKNEPLMGIKLKGVLKYAFLCAFVDTKVHKVNKNPARKNYRFVYPYVSHPLLDF